MKKNISINISGIIFHIEEDGYELLKDYLATINTYFSSFDDHKEIAADIESRIAEIFMSKLSPGKQVISSQDVTSLIATMGNVRDFQAIEEEPEKGSTQEESIPLPDAETGFKKKLFRDSTRKVLGGVAAGAGRYLDIDPIWIRLFLLVLFFGLWFIHSLTGITLLAYILLWILLPEHKYPEDRKVKKLFRNPFNRVIGGVCSGLAAYFGIDKVIFRFLFAISIFIGGAGLIFYFIFWAIVPEAKTITDKMKMEGEPVTLSNIVQNIKKNLDIKDDEGKNVWAKFILVPLQLITALLQFMGKVLGPLLIFTGGLGRIFASFILILIPVIFIFLLSIILAVLFKWISADYWMTSGTFPLEMVLNNIPKLTLFAAAGLIFIPLLVMLLSGLSLLARRRLFHRSVGWLLSSVFLMAILILAFTLPVYLYNFKKKSGYQETTQMARNKHVMVLKVREGTNYDSHKIKFRMHGTRDSTIKLVRSYKARGKTRQEAALSAKSIQYSFSVKDSVITLDPGFTYASATPYRKQSLELDLYIPEGQKFLVDETMEELLPAYFFNNVDLNNVAATNIWVYRHNEIKCLNCPEKEENTFEVNDDMEEDEYNDEEREEWSGNSSTRQYRLTNFNRVEVNGMCSINIVAGNEYKVVAHGSEDVEEKIHLSVHNEVLKIEMEEGSWFHNKGKNYIIDIEMPKLKSMEINGAAKSSITGFSSPELEINLSGASHTSLNNIEVGRLTIESSGASEVLLKGKADKVDVSLSGASHLMAYDFPVSDAKLYISGASYSEIYAYNNLSVDGSGACKVKYKGNPAIHQNLSGLSTLSREE